MGLGGLRDQEGVRRRLARLRAAMNIPSRPAMAHLLAVNDITYDAAERTGNLSLGMALLIRRKFPGVTLDWLFCGSPSGMPFDLFQALSEVRAPEGHFKRRRARL